VRGIAKAPQTGSVYHEFGVLKFGGLNNKYAPMHINDDQSPDLMNVVFDELGAITKRNGYTALNAAQIDGNPITSMFGYYQSNGTRTLIATSGTSVYKWTSNAWQSIKTGLSANSARFTFTTYLDKLYMVNGNTLDGLMQWDGLTFSKVATTPAPPAGKYVVVHKNRMYLAGDPANPSRLYMSDLGSPTSWPALNFVDVNTNDGDKITGVSEHLDGLVVFKERSIHVLRGTDPSNYVMFDAHQGAGTVSHWSIVQASNLLFYLSRDGVYTFDGHHVKLISDFITGSVLGINGQPVWNQQYLNMACGVDYNHKYWLAVPEGLYSTNNRVYVYDYIHNNWTRFDIPISCFSLFNNGTTLTLYSGDPIAGVVYQQDIGGDDNGSTINAYLTTKVFDFGAPGHFKSYKGLFFYAQQQLQPYTINVTCVGDFGRIGKTVPMNLGAGNPTTWGNFTWGNSPWGAFQNVVSRTTNISGQSRYLQFTVQGNGRNQPFVFYGWVILVNVKKRLR
jgi:hypothetical protein